jgi:hypothetical protein
VQSDGTAQSQAIRDKEDTMRTIAFALLLLGATACPAFASGTLIEAKSPTFGCQFSATLGLFQELPTVSEEDSNRILDAGHCVLIDAHQRFTVIRDLPSAYVALKDTQQDDQWVVVFVRKTDFDLLHGSPDNRSARNRPGATVHTASRGVSPPSRAGTASTGPEDMVDKAHHSRTAAGERVGAVR